MERAKLDTLLLRIMIPVWVLTSFLLSATYAGGVEPPGRHSRSHDALRVRVSVQPSKVVMRYGDVVTIKCKAKGGSKYSDIPFITFYRQLAENTIMPLSSGFPGVTIRAYVSASKRLHNQSPSGGGRYNRAVKFLTLDQDTYRTLEWGDNLFYCRGSLLSYEKNGTDKAYFIVHKS